MEPGEDPLESGVASVESGAALVESGGAPLKFGGAPMESGGAPVNKASSESEAPVALSGSSGSCLAPSLVLRFAHFMEACGNPKNKQPNGKQIKIEPTDGLGCLVSCMFGCV